MDRLTVGAAMIEISLACRTDSIFLPEIERSSDPIFRTRPDLDWVAGHDVQSVQHYAEMIELGFTWAARDGSKIVGFLTAQPFNDAVHIWQMSVHSSHQKQGIGRKLLEVALDAAKQAGLSAATLTTFRDVAWNEDFYKSCGFYTLEAPLVPAFLQNILDKETADGMPGDSRCAMACSLG